MLELPPYLQARLEQPGPVLSGGERLVYTTGS
jgi:hypothetical protein